MFGFGKARKEATLVGEAAARMAIIPFWDMFDRSFDRRIWSDPYVLGLIHGSLGAQTLPLTGRKLSTTDKGFVVLNAMRSLGASQAAIDLAMSLAESKDPDFGRGYDHALVTFFLMAGALKKEMYSEPDIVAAKEAVPTFRKATAFMNSLESRDPDQELASAYVYLKVREHKEAYYPPLA